MWCFADIVWKRVRGETSRAPAIIVYENFDSCYTRAGLLCWARDDSGEVKKKQNSIGKTLPGSYHKITDCKYLSQVRLFSRVSLLCSVARHKGPHQRTARVIKCDGLTRHRWMWVIKTGLLNEHNYFLLRLCPPLAAVVWPHSSVAGRLVLLFQRQGDYKTPN